MSNIYGRQVILPLTNKSGGSVAAGDIVVIDTTNNDAFTTSTAGAVTITVGVAQETIASNATGRVLVSGYAALVNVNASVTRGNYGKTHTVAKQATDAGAARVAGTFCQFLTGGTTPDAMVYPVDLAGAALTNPMSHVGALIYGGTAGAPTELQVGAASKVLQSDGTNPGYKYPPGYEFDYAAFTSPVNLTATSEATANTIVTGNAVTYDGSTVVLIEFFCPYLTTNSSGNALAQLALYDGSGSIGIMALVTQDYTSNVYRSVVHATYRLTPSAATKTYSIRGYTSTGTAVAGAGAGGNGNYTPGFIRQTKVSGGA